MTYAGSTTTLEEHYTFEAFGTMTSAVDGSGDPLIAQPTTRYNFTAQEYISVLDVYYYDKRIYDAPTAQFMSPDPIEHDQKNKYRPFSNSPTNYTDPTGLEDGPPGPNGPTYFRGGEYVVDGRLYAKIGSEFQQVQGPLQPTAPRLEDFLEDDPLYSLGLNSFRAWSSYQAATAKFAELYPELYESHLREVAAERLKALAKSNAPQIGPRDPANDAANV